MYILLPLFSICHLRIHIGSSFLYVHQVVYDLVKHKFAAPNQVATIYDMKEVRLLTSLRIIKVLKDCILNKKNKMKMQRVEDGRNYYTFEYELRTPNYATTSFATVAVGNSKHRL